jgi:hypothetical protein
MAKATKSHPANTESSGPVSAPWSTNVDKKGLKSLTRPPTVKIKDMPVGASLDVTVYDLVPSAQKDIKNPLLLCTLNSDDSKIAIPVVGGLAGTFLADKDGVDLAEVTKDDLADGILDTRVVITKIGTKLSTKWKADSGQPREYPIFEVAISE